jgi:hypothetical protein
LAQPAALKAVAQAVAVRRHAEHPTSDVPTSTDLPVGDDDVESALANLRDATHRVEVALASWRLKRASDDVFAARLAAVRRALDGDASNPGDDPQ